MNRRAKPKKPLRNPSHIVFPGKGGTPYPVVEQLPRDQDDLELVVGQKFLGSLRHFKGIQYEELALGTEPADLTCHSQDGKVIDIQVVEVIDHKRRQLWHMRSSYREALVRELDEDLAAFSGCQVTLVDTGEPPYLPEVNSISGHETVQLLAEHIRTIAGEIHTLEVGKIRSRSTTTVHSKRKVGVSVQRFEPVGESGTGFKWTGSDPGYRSDVSRGLLTAAVQTKIDKKYAKPETARFVLLAYSVETIFRENDPDIAEARELLETLPHPFSEAWFLYLYAEKELGSLVQIWSDDDGND